MDIRYKSFIVFFVAATISLFSFLLFSLKNEVIKFHRVKSSSSDEASVEMIKARDEYFFNMLRDPVTNKIPWDIRQKELKFAKQLNEKNASLNKASSTNLTWAEAGPNNVGGRTRALAVDITNPNIIIAGGASGGIWKSTDNGTTWILKSSTSTILSISSIAQDPRPGFTNIWYYSSGEFSHNLAGTIGTSFTGDGIYKSTDNGETWNVLTSTHSPDVTEWDGNFDFVLRIVVSPVNGNIFVAANAIGIFKSTDGGNSFTKVLGDLNEHIYSDVAVASNGTVLAVLSRAYQGITPSKSPGLYKSTNDGAQWTDITPGDYPSTSLRSVLAIAPSNPNTGYLFTNTGATSNNKEVNKFFKINIGGETSEDRSGNLPDFTSLGGVAAQVGYVTTQGGYDMIIAVKPDDENFVLVGGSSLFRSTDGFATKPLDNKTAWIGGYHPQSFGYPNFHADVHSFAFDPTDPKKMWWGNDGGLSYTSDITNTSYETYLPWENRNNGYNVTQFYHISIGKNNADNRIMGGTQDNGTPYMVFNGAITNQIEDVSSGDGSFSYFGQNFAYTSSQSGSVNRLKYDQQGNPSWSSGWSNITPSGATNMFFINPFVVDPGDEDVMYYPAGNVLWRNNQLSSIADFQNGTSTGWTKLDNLTVPTGYGIYALNISTNPAHILYYAAFNPNAAPKIYKLTNSSTATSGAEDISITSATSGAYINDITVNPDDGNEILVVMSNYNITGLYHSTNGGQSYTAIEGNLEGTDQNPGPSLRAASILPGSGGKTYYVATSIGVFSTSQLNGNNTVWTQEGQNVMGNVIVSSITSRKSDGRVVIGTHGRGAFVGSGSGGTAAVLNVNINELNIEVYPELTRNTSFRISNPGGAQLTYSISASGGETNINKVITSNLPKSSLSLSHKMSNEFKEKQFQQLKFEKNLHKNVSDSKLGGFPTTDELILDDGDDFASDYTGSGPNTYFYWRNDFTPENDFALEKVKFNMKTESSSTNTVEIAIEANTVFLFDTVMTMEVSQNGKWFEFQFPQWVLGNLRFNKGQKFTIIIGAQNNNVYFPAAFDENGQKPGNSYYGYWTYFELTGWVFSGWTNLKDFPGFLNAVFLIRAVGNSGSGGTNQSPVANAQVLPNPAQINQTVSFNGSGSYDPDGQITNYLWEYGDGQTGTQANSTHSYTQTGQFTYRLTVTDNKGATNQATGQITITEGGGTTRFTISPLSGNISAGGFQDILVTYNSQGLPEGNYNGQITITSNGGNIIIPVNILISTTAENNDNPGGVYSYKLEQNYPNPFNPSTKIRWHLPETSFVTLKVYNINGEEIATLLNEFENPGIHETVFNANNLEKGYTLTSGVYFYRLVSKNFVDTKKFVLLK